MNLLAMVLPYGVRTACTNDSFAVLRRLESSSDRPSVTAFLVCPWICPPARNTQKLKTKCLGFAPPSLREVVEKYSRKPTQRSRVTTTRTVTANHQSAHSSHPHPFVATTTTNTLQPKKELFSPLTLTTKAQKHN